MKILVIGPPLYGLLYPVASLAQALRSAGQEVVVASAGAFAERICQAGLVAFDAAPGFDSEDDYRRREDERKRKNVGTAPGGFSFFSDEMADDLVDFAEEWHPDLIIYPPLGVVGRLLGAKLGIPTVMQVVGFAHQEFHINTVTEAMTGALSRHGVTTDVDKLPPDVRWLDVAPTSMSILEHPAEQTLPMRYVPYNGGAVIENWWYEKNHRPRVLVSLGTLKPMVDGLDLINWIMHRAGELEAEFVLQLGHNAREELDHELPDNVRLLDWIPMGGLMESADVFIHHGGAGNTLTALNAGVPQIVFGEGADRPTNARIVAERGCGVVPGEEGLTGELIETVLGDEGIRATAAEVLAEMQQMPSPAETALELIRLVREG